MRRLASTVGRSPGVVGGLGSNVARWPRSNGGPLVGWRVTSDALTQTRQPKLCRRLRNCGREAGMDARPHPPPGGKDAPQVGNWRRPVALGPRPAGPAGRRPRKATGHRYAALTCWRQVLTHVWLSQCRRRPCKDALRHEAAKSIFGVAVDQVSGIDGDDAAHSTTRQRSDAIHQTASGPCPPPLWPQAAGGMAQRPNQRHGSLGRSPEGGPHAACRCSEAAAHNQGRACRWAIALRRTPHKLLFPTCSERDVGDVLARHTPSFRPLVADFYAPGRTRLLLAFSKWHPRKKCPRQRPVGVHRSEAQGDYCSAIWS